MLFVNLVISILVITCIEEYDEFYKANNGGGNGRSNGNGSNSNTSLFPSMIFKSINPGLIVFISIIIFAFSLVIIIPIVYIIYIQYKNYMNNKKKIMKFKEKQEKQGLELDYSTNLI